MGEDQGDQEPTPQELEEAGAMLGLTISGLQMIGRIRAQADRLIEEVVDAVAEQTGERIQVHRPSITDAHWADLTAMESQAYAYLEAMKLVRQWMLPGDRRTLGALLKVIPPNVARQIVERLRDAAG